MPLEVCFLVLFFINMRTDCGETVLTKKVISFTYKNLVITAVRTEMKTVDKRCKKLLPSLTSFGMSVV